MLTLQIVVSETIETKYCSYIVAYNILTNYLQIYSIYKITNLKLYFCIKNRMNMNLVSFNIDLVYLWVDGSDLRWLEKKRKITDKFDDTSELNNRGRYISNDELKYSLRSVEKNIPWINKIYIITDDQYPDWLNINHPLIQIIDHKEILPEKALPCFNSSVIEYFIYKIPNLEEHFLLANDDMFFYKKLSPDYFFNEDEQPIVRLKKKILGKNHYKIKRLFRKQLGQYISKVVDGAKLVGKLYGIYYSAVPHHNTDAYRKSDYKYAIEHVFDIQVDHSLTSHTRRYGDFHRSAISYYTLAAGKAQVKYVGRRESSRINVQKRNYFEYMKKYNPDQFCLNDNQHAKDKDRKRIKPFLESLFPEKSSFEL